MGTVIEYAGNAAAAEYAISQMIRENSGCPARDFTRARSSLSLSLSLSFSFFFLFIRTHGHTRAHEGTRYSVQIIAEIRTRSEMEMEKQRLLPELEELGEGGKSCSYTRTVDIKAYSE